MAENKVKKLLCILMSIVFFLICINPTSSLAFTVNTQPVDANCGGGCNGYYANHFTANFQIDNLPNINYYKASNFKVTMNHYNQFGDEWGLMHLQVYSLGDRILSDISQASNLRTEFYSSYWVTVNQSLNIFKGNNSVSFTMGYVLKNPNGTVAQRWYPTRKATDIN